MQPKFLSFEAGFGTSLQHNQSGDAVLTSLPTDSKERYCLYYYFLASPDSPMPSILHQVPFHLNTLLQVFRKSLIAKQEKNARVVHMFSSSR